MGCCQGSKSAEENKNVDTPEKIEATKEANKKVQSNTPAPQPTQNAPDQTKETQQQEPEVVQKANIVITPAEINENEISNNEKNDDEPSENILKDARFVDSLRGHDKKAVLEEQSQRNLSMFDHQYDTYAQGQAFMPQYMVFYCKTQKKKMNTCAQQYRNDQRAVQKKTKKKKKRGKEDEGSKIHIAVTQLRKEAHMQNV
ncbi:hypothetical protein RFI_13619 [Reticulomyxa filosa]|uniref:Uncharacterized protein n=1 Tax=Reticulomyxa filosa TaxID=46433 RepID=X6NB97_RETFI|nr:hypothetical protein RFI_13619 [Reticulomyxa filosa]|eukprot:ETO23560.1 hypothetical protein RFI_13619 [Reticulomyxa filosa]